MASTKELVAKLTEQQDVAYKAYKQLEIQAGQANTPGHEGSRAAMASDLAAELNSKTPPGKDSKGKEIPQQYVYGPAARVRIAQLLAMVGGAKEVPVLVEAISDLDVREAARMSLDRNVSEEATQALVKALDEVGPVFLIGVVNSLARRQGAGVVAALRKAADSECPEVQLAAIEALASFNDPALDEVFAKMAKCPCQAAKSRIAKARLRYANQLEKSGNKAAAASVYRAVLWSRVDAPQEKAAKNALKGL